MHNVDPEQDELSLEQTAAAFLSSHGASDVARNVRQAPFGIRTAIEAALARANRNGCVSLGGTTFGQSYARRVLDAMNGQL